MSTKCTIAYRYETADEPGFHLYEDCFDIDDGAGMPVYLQLDGIHTGLETRRCGATVTVKLYREMAQVLGLIKSKDNTQEKWLGIFGEETVNVLNVNLQIAKDLNLANEVE